MKLYYFTNLVSRFYSFILLFFIDMCVSPNVSVTFIKIPPLTLCYILILSILIYVYQFHLLD